MRLSFCFLYSGEQHSQTRTQTKKRWGPALWLWKGLVAPAGAKLRKQQSKIRPHKEKKKRQSQHETHKATNKKAACRKRNSRTAIPHSKPNHWRASNLHAALTENSRPLAGGYASVNRFARNGGRSQTNRYPQNIEFHLACGSADIG